MYSIDSSGKGFKVDEVKYDLSGTCFYVVRKHGDFEVNISSTINGRFALTPTKVNDMIVNGTRYPNTINGWNQCYLALQGMLVSK